MAFFCILVLSVRGWASLCLPAGCHQRVLVESYHNVAQSAWCHPYQCFSRDHTWTRNFTFLSLFWVLMEEWQPGGDFGLAHSLCSNEAESHPSLLVCQTKTNEIHAQAHFSQCSKKKIQEESWKQLEKTDNRLAEEKQFESLQIPHQKPWKHNVFRC